MPEAPLKIRRASPDEVDELADLVEEASQANAWLFAPERVDSVALARMLKPPNITSVAVWEFKTAGVAIFERRASSTLRMAQLAVAPSLRRKGIASRMLAAIEQEARSSNVNLIEVEIADELGLSGLFVNAGFHAESREMIFSGRGAKQPYCRVTYSKGLT